MTVQNQHADLGLRERKKRATKLAIEQAAVTLVLKHGYEETTVEMICEEAGVSPRTFFNYAGSKDGAVLGVGIPFEDSQLQERFIAGRGGNVLEDLITTIAEVFETMPIESRALFETRHKIVCRYPHLMQREFARMEEAKDMLFSLIVQRLESDAKKSGSKEGESKSEAISFNDYAHMVVSLTFGITRYVSLKWADCPTKDRIGELFNEAYALARDVTGEG